MSDLGHARIHSDTRTVNPRTLLLSIRPSARQRTCRPKFILSQPKRSEDPQWHAHLQGINPHFCQRQNMVGQGKDGENFRRNKRLSTTKNMGKRSQSDGCVAILRTKPSETGSAYSVTVGYTVRIDNAQEAPDPSQVDTQGIRHKYNNRVSHKLLSLDSNIAKLSHFS